MQVSFKSVLQNEMSYFYLLALVNPPSCHHRARPGDPEILFYFLPWIAGTSPAMT